jgi:hypothetical protein
VPVLQVAIEPLTGLLTRIAVLVSVLAIVHRATSGWTRRRVLGFVLLAVVGFLAGGVPEGRHVGGWLAAGALLGATLPLVYVGVLRLDLTMAPIAVGTMAAIAVIVRGAQRAFPGALPGSIAAALLMAVLAWWCFGTLRRWRERAESAGV